MRQFDSLGRGPRTSETKTWWTTIKKGISLTIILWAVACLIWFLLSFGAWLNDPHSPWVHWFKERPRVWFSVNVYLGIPVLLGTLVWAWQELLDEDFTSLHGKHALSGIMPMTILVRLVMTAGTAWMWWRRNRPVKISRREALEAEYNRKFGKDEN